VCARARCLANVAQLTSERRPTASFLRPAAGAAQPESSVVITTYPMISYGGRRNEVSDRAMRRIRAMEWGLLILDEVHQVPARTFRRVLSACPAHCKLGLTATMIREDDRIEDLNFLIGPKLYEANWLDLADCGHLARVQCTEVWTPMTAEFCAEYLKARSAPHPWRRKLLYAMNPNKVNIGTCLRYYETHFHLCSGKGVCVFDQLP
jgi:DNA excision repair protein ERCC-3